MPYISQQQRTEIQRLIAELVTDETTTGELNYILTTIVGEYVVRKGLRYSYINDVLGALIGCLLEFYRRVALPYEDTKIEENGDVGVYLMIAAMLQSLKA